MFLRTQTYKSTENFSAQIERLKSALEMADAVIIGAGAGLSTSAGFTYSGERFQKYFSDFAKKYQFEDMYAGGFYPYQTPEEHWAYWSRYIYINRYMNAPKSTYKDIFALVKDKDYFVLTTNVDHCFQKAGFDKKRLFYTQGDYGLFQCSEPCHNDTYDNETVIRKMVLAQGFTIGNNDELILPANNKLKMSVPTELIPKCPKCSKPMSMNLRADDTFVQDSGWDKAAERYENFIRVHKYQRIVFLELGVGFNTPVIIKYPFWQMTAENPNATFVCLNYGQAGVPFEIKTQSICIDEDIHKTIGDLMK
ncbi:MAG: Sir2 silent information regulator family NAD-dependent deacetylase [Ruminococcus sp.]|nr:Sir2 silent information regulator family NAD-dependent deacetylase [Ruminococcus sp.]